MMIFQLNFFVNPFQFKVIDFHLISEHLFTFSFLSIPLIGKRGNVVSDLKFGPCFIERLGHFLLFAPTIPSDQNYQTWPNTALSNLKKLKIIDHRKSGPLRCDVQSSRSCSLLFSIPLFIQPRTDQIVW